MTDNDKTKVALFWISDILEIKKIPFQITGGLAAKIYGSPRPLNDIDIDIPTENIPNILEDLKPYIIYGPDYHFEDAKFRAPLITLNYNGQEMDITGATNSQMSNREETAWLPYPCDFRRVTHQEVFGRLLPVISREDLIAYKKEMVGEHHFVDVKEIGANND